MTSRDTPVLTNLRPTGDYLVEDLHRAGGIPAVLKELEPLLDGGAATAVDRSEDTRPLGSLRGRVGGW
jgi:dihydroxy-acid dehydratase